MIRTEYICDWCKRTIDGPPYGPMRVAITALEHGCELNLDYCGWKCCVMHIDWLSKQPNFQSSTRKEK